MSERCSPSHVDAPPGTIHAGYVTGGADWEGRGSVFSSKGEKDGEQEDSEEDSMHEVSDMFIDTCRHASLYLTRNGTWQNPMHQVSVDE